MRCRQEDYVHAVPWPAVWNEKPTYSFHFTPKFLVAVSVMEKKNILAYFSDFSLKEDAFFSLCLVIKKRKYMIK